MDDTAKLREEIAELRAVLGLLVEVLVARGDLGAGHPALIEKIKRSARQATRPTVRLGIYPDKYALTGADIDCPSLLHLCQARCCTYSVALTRQDIEENVVKWDLDQPYLLRHDPDGYCAHMDRASGGCTAYEHRPGTCRAYDCRQDRRVWLDFEQKIPAPMPPSVVPIR